MKIIFQHDGVLPVLKYGGTERIIFWLMKELVKLGHQVSLIGHPDSQVQQHGIELIKTQEAWTEKIPANADLVHLFTSPREWPHDIPLIVTIEGNAKPGEELWPNTVFVSKKHASNHGSHSYVYNGIDFEEYPLVREITQRFDHFLFLAKANWKVKNLSHCIDAVKKNKKYLHVAGGRAWSLSHRITSYGMVAQSQKSQLFKKVDALLWPVRWHEPFGIAVVEAFSQGLPVIASPYGSLPELVGPDMGILCRNYSDFEVALSPETHSFDGEKIRRLAREKFSSLAMTKAYLELYERVIGSPEPLNPRPPCWQEGKDPEELLDF